MLMSALCPKTLMHNFFEMSGCSSLGRLNASAWPSIHIGFSTMRRSPVSADDGLGLAEVNLVEPVKCGSETPNYAAVYREVSDANVGR